MKRTGFALLEFNPTFNLSQKKALRDGLSGVVQRRKTLWVVNDETVSLERLTYQGTNAEGAHRYGEHTQFGLNDFLRLPVPPTLGASDIEEADIEGLDFRDDYLWLVGSHSLKRKQPEENKSAEENVKRLEKVSSDGNRFLLARIPLVEENGLPTLKKAVAQHDKRLTASQLSGDSASNDLMAALRQDEHLPPFFAIPSKDNGFDIEGLAVVSKRLFIGLRGPVLRGWAIILEVEPEEKDNDASTLKLKNIGPGHRPYRKHFLQLGGLGIRDLCVQDSDLLILTGPTMDLDGPVTLFRWPGGALPSSESLVFAKNLITVFQVPYGQGNLKGKDHAEGLTLFAPDGSTNRSVLIVYDSAAQSRTTRNNSVEADIFSL
ncbi:MAG: DUF3616 domain-containing protein [Deltaproteobacteria bacterium]|nr:DUF3616 domain-containing protein [Deltaproteobacteria bacterium]